MLLNLASEFVEAYNQSDSLVVLNLFENVVSIESERIVE